jgi:hypothetical protein
MPIHCRPPAGLSFWLGLPGGPRAQGKDTIRRACTPPAHSISTRAAERLRRDPVCLSEGVGNLFPPPERPPTERGRAPLRGTAAARNAGAHQAEELEPSAPGTDALSAGHWSLQPPVLSFSIRLMMGAKIESTTPPTMTPMKVISRGSIRLVRLFTIALTWLS